MENQIRRSTSAAASGFLDKPLNLFTQVNFGDIKCKCLII
jgi:hypothetical protein